MNLSVSHMDPHVPQLDSTGFFVGFSVGTKLGSEVGLKLGLSVGFIVGLKLGSEVGLKLGLSVIIVCPIENSLTSASVHSVMPDCSSRDTQETPSELASNFQSTGDQ